MTLKAVKMRDFYSKFFNISDTVEFTQFTLYKYAI